ncbi:ribosomal RNA small subunit methyltransferase I, partial [Striga asiatica]
LHFISSHSLLYPVRSLLTPHRKNCKNLLLWSAKNTSLMAKKVTSVALHAKKKKNPIQKNIGKTKKLGKVLENVFNYMKSDTYMFAPLISPHPFYPTPSPDSFGGFDQKEKKKLGESVKEYLKSNCYMYASIASASPLKGHECEEKVDINNTGNQTESRVEELNKQTDSTMNKCREIENGEIPNRTNRVVVKHNLLHRETVKHVVHQNCRAPFGPEKVSPQKKGRRALEVE